MVLERFFHFFRREFSEYTNAVVVNIYELNSYRLKATMQNKA